MEPAGAVASVACAVVIVGLAPVVARAWRRGAPRAEVCALSLIAAAVTLLGAFIAQSAGAARFDTGRFLIGMGAGAAVGLTLGCAVLLIARPSQPGG